MPNFPASLDNGASLPSPSAGNNTNNPSHAALHAAENAAIIAVEGKVGTGATVPAANQLLVGTGAGTSAWQGLTSAQLAAVLSDETGSGSAVFANTPVLITPKVDTINENTLNNGVTVGGVNLKAGVVTGSGAGLTAGSTPGTALAANSVDASKVKWNATGAGAGIWWEELGRVTLGSAAAAMTIASFTARKYLHILVNHLQVGLTVESMRFNNDSGANYSRRSAVNQGADATTSGATAIDTYSDNGQTRKLEFFTTNFLATAKLSTYTINVTSAAGAVPSNRVEGVGIWNNTVAQITRVDYLTSSGQFAAGSEMIVLGHD
jgi:hypothetical protein